MPQNNRIKTENHQHKYFQHLRRISRTYSKKLWRTSSDASMLSLGAQSHNMGSLVMDFPQQILLAVEKHGSVISYEFAKALNEPHQRIVGAIKSLESLGEVSSAMNILHDLSISQESLGVEVLFNNWLFS